MLPIKTEIGRISRCLVENPRAAHSLRIYLHAVGGQMELKFHIRILQHYHARAEQSRLPIEIIELDRHLRGNLETTILVRYNPSVAAAAEFKAGNRTTTFTQHLSAKRMLGRTYRLRLGSCLFEIIQQRHQAVNLLRRRGISAWE